MRPVSQKRNAVRYLLDSVLGSESHIRLLRLLAYEVDEPIGTSDAARLAGLTRAGAGKALGHLCDSGLIERIGRGRSVHYRPRERDQIVQALGYLFAREYEVYESLVSAMRKTFADVHEVREAWIERWPTVAGDSIEIKVIAEVKAMEWIGDELRSRLTALEREHNLIIEVALFTRADAPAPDSDPLFLRTTESERISGMEPPAPTHDAVDQRSLLLARGMARLIQSDPSLVMRAKRHVNRLLNEGPGASGGDLAEWRQLLDTYSTKRLADLLVSRSSRAARLRQSSPFLAVLSAAERDDLLEMLEKQQ